MSKYVVLAIVCVGLLATSAMGQTGEVYSLNVVGFQKLSAESNGLTMTSTPFSRGQATIDDVIGDQLTAGKAEAGADLVIMWNATNQAYERFWLRNTDGQWYTGGGTPELATNTFIDTEMGFWIQSRRDSNQIVVLSGDVVDDAVVTNRLVPGLTMVSYPYSTEININSSGLTNGNAGKAEAGADLVIAWDTAEQAYDRYWLRTLDKKWYTGGGTPEIATNVTVGAGRAFWYQNRNSVDFEWVEARPYTL